MNYTVDQIGYKVREIGQILSTIDSLDEKTEWITDIIMESAKDEKDNAINILDIVRDNLDWR